MKLVYTHATFTIAATHARDANDGLFVRRIPISVVPPMIECTRHDTSAQRYRLFDPDHWTADLIEAPLARRAWVVQERILSPRVLFFAKTQIYFQCCSFTACESFPGGRPLWHVHTGFEGPKHTGISPEEAWHDAAMKYNKASLTRVSDRVVAIAGVAERMQELLKDSYVIGLWKRFLPLGLAWDSYGGQRVTPYLAPTWSWLSLTGGIKQYEPSQQVGDPFIEIRQIHVQPQNPKHITGNIMPGAWLIAYGTLKPASLEEDARYARSRYPRYVWRCDGVKNNPNYHGSFGLDVVAVTGVPASEVFLLPVVTISEFDGSKAIRGLMLVLADELEDTYERVGSFAVPEDKSERLFLRRMEPLAGISRQGLRGRLEDSREHRDSDDDVEWERIPAQDIKIM
ncbi:hypothetical protein LTR85_011435 [Meristemomyces frigidus]|nr:hypothetical protein LTR85_011435 [Meristemomyces frigidus]